MSATKANPRSHRIASSPKRRGRLPISRSSIGAGLSTLQRWPTWIVSPRGSMRIPMWIRSLWIPGNSTAPLSRKAWRTSQATLTDGFGFVLLTGLPFDRWNERTARAISWLLCHFVAPPVMQKWTGTRVYDVRDTGAQLAHGVRRSLTNLKQDLHTDGPWLPTTADYMALACIRQADAGGVSRISSLVAAHNWFSPHTSPAPRAVVCRVLVGPPGGTRRRRASGKLSSGL